MDKEALMEKAETLTLNSDTAMALVEIAIRFLDRHEDKCAWCGSYERHHPGCPVGIIEMAEE